jgi:RNA polymerase sigma-70 factor, ECF subfamily
MGGEASTPAQMVWPRSRKDVRVLTGDEAEFTALVRRQARFVFRVAYAVLLNAHDAEDAVQETFLKLYRNGGWREAKNEQAFLARTAWRVAVDARRRLSIQRASSALPIMRPAIPALQFDADAGASLNSDPLSPRPGPEAILLAADRHAAIHAAIDSLPEELRVPLVLASFDELNSREIGKILGVPEGTVRTRLQRARQMLRRKLAGLGGGSLCLKTAK